MSDMQSEKFELKQYQISSLLGFIEAKQFVIPEIQRPFVWKRRQVRDLIDSLYNGYPTGYIITWKNPDVHTKDGNVANGNHILIDGQQRITAIMAAIVGLEVLDEDFNRIKIKIAFNPFAEDSSKRFAVQDASHLKDKRWIPDISEIFKNDFNAYTFISEYNNNNPDISPQDINKALDKLREICHRQIGVIELSNTLDIYEVTEIFIRINSKGTSLSQSDFVMSKMAADMTYGGNMLRRVVDYFCHLAVKPEFYEQMTKDEDFMSTTYAQQIKWLYHDNDELYDPSYGDMLRVAFMYKFKRGKLVDLVSLLSGRDFETKEFREDIIEDSYNKLEQGINDFINENNFKNFLLAIRGAGFKSSKLLNSQMTIDFAYMLYLDLLKGGDISAAQVKRHVQKWFVLSTLTGRYVGSPESVMSRDIRLINEKGFAIYAKEIEESVLSDTFWNVTLPQNLESSSINSPAFSTFIAAQINRNSDSLFQSGTTVADLVEIAGDIHHIFPKAYLKKNGINNRAKYNQVANYTYLDTHVNKAVGDKAPKEYFAIMCNQCDTHEASIGNIKDIGELKDNLKDNAIPESVFTMEYGDFEEFLLQRRKLMAKFIENYYKCL